MGLSGLRSENWKVWRVVYMLQLADEVRGDETISRDPQVGQGCLSAVLSKIQGWPVLGCLPD